MGYRFDIEKFKIVATGGIYVKTFPAPDKITIDSKIYVKPGLFSNWIFIPNLLPNDHNILIEKNGYHVYTKNLPVQEKEVTKLDNILLIKENLLFSNLSNTTKSPFEVIKTPAIKNLVTFQNLDNNIIWLSSDGFLYRSDLNGKNSEKLTKTPIKIKKVNYKIIASPSNIFLNNNGSLMYLNSEKNDLEIFTNFILGAQISPNEKEILYFTDKKIFISEINKPSKTKIIYQTNNKIGECFWINNYYIVFTDNGKLVISETDLRSNINTVTLPQSVDNSLIFFNQQDGKLYIKTKESILFSEKILQ
jgi:hypothetical protein